MSGPVELETGATVHRDTVERAALAAEALAAELRKGLDDGLMSWVYLTEKANALQAAMTSVAYQGYSS